jgi:hypothetical protein
MNEAPRGKKRPVSALMPALSSREFFVFVLYFFWRFEMSWSGRQQTEAEYQRELDALEAEWGDEFPQVLRGMKPGPITDETRAWADGVLRSLER